MSGFNKEHNLLLQKIALAKKSTIIKVKYLINTYVINNLYIYLIKVSESE